MKGYYISYGHVQGIFIKTDCELEALLRTIAASQEWLGFVGQSGKMFYVKRSEIYHVEPV
jgi:hypothetical protein